jgi:hypothetical protein
MVHQSEIPAPATDDHYVGGGELHWDLHCPEFQSSNNSHRPSRLLPCHSDANAETIIATKFVNDTPPAVAMTRPLCVFPKVAKYKGSGNPNIAANFVCVADEPDFNQTPAPKYGP